MFIDKKTKFHEIYDGKNLSGWLQIIKVKIQWFFLGLEYNQIQ